MRFFCLLLCAASACIAESVPVPGPDTAEGEIAAKIAEILPRWHYSRMAFDDAVSDKLFAAYVKRLDGQRRYLLKSDIDEFAPQRLALDDAMMAGDLQVGYALHARFVQRVGERVAYLRQVLQEPQDFSVKEYYRSDRSEAPWATSVAELDEIWRRLVKNNLLVHALDDEAKADAAATATGDGGDEAESAAGDDEPAAAQPAPAADGWIPEAAATDDDEPPAVDPSPAQELLESYERFLSRLEARQSLEILEIYLTSLAKVYDPHSAYMAPATRDDFDIKMKHSLEGIGARLTTENGATEVVDIIVGGPADRDGRLQAGDRIVAVRQEDQAKAVDIMDMPIRKVVQYIRGDKGSRVYLSVIPDGESMGSTPVIIDIVRDTVQLKDRDARSEVIYVPKATADLYKPNPAPEESYRILVINLSSFYTDFDKRRQGGDYKSATRDVQALIDAERAAGIDAIVMDLRGNKGGSMDEAITLSGLFFRSGPAVQVRDSAGRIREHHDEDGICHFDGPLVIALDRHSASSSEIFAGCIQDYGRGVIIGDRQTYGKGTMQTLNKLDRFFRTDPVFKDREAGTLRLTTGAFYRVSGATTQRHGVQPDIIVPSFRDDAEIGEPYLDNSLNCLPIEPLTVCYGGSDVRPLLPQLRAAVDQRLHQNPAYDDYLVDVAFAAERRQQSKLLPLQIDQRRRQLDEEDLWRDHLETHDEALKMSFSKFYWLLDEAIFVAHDLIQLTSTPDTAAAIAEDPEDPASEVQH